ncbi:hypothetical protein QYE76_049341 [Lolium multiflorum]|uniref:Reverse transcriptase n=1 Tax=Lolium multiflorum TaxID=4521 RepID=A0AAD8SMV2_LOLMU|nr:hypothetical protein QYE76_049341 [Lolium multiflorum]
MRAFREVTEDCGLIDLGFSGLPYTWDNRQEGSANVKERIDRAFGNDGLLNLFQVVKVKHVSVVQSDHCMIQTELKKHVSHRPLGMRAFKYENVWQTHGDYDKVVVDLWQKALRGVGLEGFAKTLSSMQNGLSSWGTATFGDFKKKLSNLRRELDRVRRISLGRGPSPEEKKIMERINEVLFQEEIWIKQRSRVNWLQSGDRNTAYFHACASQRKRMNSISSLQREDGTWCDDAEEVKDAVQGFYKYLYTSEGAPDMQGLIDLVHEKVVQEDKVNLEADFTEEEVKRALFQMHPSKAPGVDGFTAGFYQRHWSLVGPKLCGAVLGFLNGGEMPEEINDTAITLIPKLTRSNNEAQQGEDDHLATAMDPWSRGELLTHHSGGDHGGVESSGDESPPSRVPEAISESPEMGSRRRRLCKVSVSWLSPGATEALSRRRVNAGGTRGPRGRAARGPRRPPPGRLVAPLR